MSTRFPFDRDDARLTQLKAELAARLGRAVEILTSEPTLDEPDGALIVTDPGTDQPLDLDDALVAEVVAAHVPVPPPPSPERAALDRFDAATTIAGRLAAFRDYLALRVEEQERARGALQERRRAMRELRLSRQLGLPNGPQPGPLASP